MGACKPRQNVRKVDGGKVLGGSEANAAFDVGLQDARAGLVGQMQQLPRIIEQDLAVGRQQEIAAIALEHAPSETVFKLLDLQADGGLGAPNPFRGPREAGVVDHRDECPQQVEVERR